MRVIGQLLKHSDGVRAVVVVRHGLNDSPGRIARRADWWTYTAAQAAKAGPWRRVETDFFSRVDDGTVESLFRYEHEDRPWT